MGSWPVIPTLEDGYQRFASNPFLDVQHSAGYDLILAGLGLITREIAFIVLIQHLAGIVTALVICAATRRATGSAWAGLLPAAAVLLDPDQIFLEHSIMSETWLILAVAVALYGAVRAGLEPDRWWLFAPLCGLALGIAVMIRSAALPLAVVTVLAVLLYGRRPLRRPWHSLRAAAVCAAVAVLSLLAFAGANAAFGHRFAIGPVSSWYLYGRVAQFADCGQFTPPPGTAALCQRIPPNRRPTAYVYMFGSQSPAVRVYGGFGHGDASVASWSHRALEAQPLDFLTTAWGYLRGYWIPSWLPTRLKSGSNGLDPQLDFTNPGNIFVDAAIHQDLQSYYHPFRVHTEQGLLRFLHDWQRVIRFGATLLFITTLLVILGLAIGPRLVRVNCLLFGVGGVSLILVPALLSTYAGRYTVPMAAPMMAAAAVVLTELYRRIRKRAFAAPRPGPWPAPV